MQPSSLNHLVRTWSVGFVSLLNQGSICRWHHRKICGDDIISIGPLLVCVIQADSRCQTRSVLQHRRTTAHCSSSSSSSSSGLQTPLPSDWSELRHASSWLDEEESAWIFHLLPDITLIITDSPADSQNTELSKLENVRKNTISSTREENYIIICLCKAAGSLSILNSHWSFLKSSSQNCFQPVRVQPFEGSIVENLGEYHTQNLEKENIPEHIFLLT